MIIGSTQETAKNETRAALTPAMVKSYIKFGFKIIIESGLGEKSFITDNQFLESGAEIIHSASEIYQKSNIIIQVNPPSLEKIEHLKEKSLLISLIQTTNQLETTKLISIHFN